MQNLTNEDIHKWISRLVGVFLLLQLLFPPKVWTMENSFIGGNLSHSVPIGHSFIFSDPMAMQSQFIGGRTSILWTQLILQIVITCAVWAITMRFAQKSSRAA